MVDSYYPTSYDEALELLSQENMIIIGGGTDLMVKRRNWSQLLPKFEGKVMFIAGLEELNYVDRQGSNVHIGAGVTLEDIMDHFHTPELLIDAIEVMASPAIRHTATLAGNVVNASPAGDSLPVLYLLDAIIVLESNHGMRHVPISEFILGPGQTSINGDEMIKEIVIHDHSFNHAIYKKIGGRQADAISKVCFTAALTVKKHVIEDFRMVFGSVAPTMVRRPEIEEKINGQTTSWLKDNREMLVDAYAAYIRPIDDQRSSAEYRKKICRNLMHDFMHIN